MINRLYSVVRSLLVAVVILFLFGLQAQARIYFVTDTNDTTRVTSLRGAIIDANRRGGNNTIILIQSGLLGLISQQANHGGSKPQIFHLTISGADEDAARTGDLDITRGNLTIVGVGTNVTVDATALGDRVFQVFLRAGLTLENLTITGGTAPGNGYAYIEDGESGGAIFNAGELTLNNCVIIANSSGGGNYVMGNGGGTSGGDGGGIYSSGILTMNKCIVAGNSSGEGVDGAYGGNGGGIKNDGVALLTACIVRENLSGAGGGPGGNALGWGGSGGNGGGIYNSGTIVLNNCIVSTNASGWGGNGGGPSGTITGFPTGGPGGPGGNGAGIYNAGQMRLNFSTVNGNLCGSGGGGSYGSTGNPGVGGSGAGIFNAGKLSLNTSTISDNLCGTGGTGSSGAFRSFDNMPPSTGGTGGGGGGICNAGLLDLTSCTIALNQTGVGGDGGNSLSFNDPSAVAASGGQSGDGGGILNAASSTNVTVRNTLIALNLINAGGTGGTNTEYNQTTGQVGNSGTDGIGFDVAGDFTSQKFNLIGIADGSTGFVNGVNSDQVGSIATPIDPLIGPLQMNGGFTPTHALLLGSPAIDQGNSFGIHTDQRGHHRPYNYTVITNASGGDGSDIGAFEMGSAPGGSISRHFAR
jgi:hypothetical protein